MPADLEIDFKSWISVLKDISRSDERKTVPTSPISAAAPVTKTEVRRTHFLDLPEEIRNRVYRYAVIDEYFVVVPTNGEQFCFSFIRKFRSC